MMFGLTIQDLLPVSRPRRQHILVVDDDVFLKPIMRRIIRSIDPSIEMHWATSLKDACIRLESVDYSMVVVDCLLQKDASGLALWELCKTNYPDLPFLMISGLSRKSIEHISGPDKTMPSFLHKPFLSRECGDRIREALSLGP